MNKRTVTRSEVTSALENTENLDEAAEILSINITELREICDSLYIDLTSLENFSQTYYFTFGRAHVTKLDSPLKDEFCMADSWVRVIARDASEARRLFEKEFTSVYMETIYRFAFQYAAKDFTAKPEYFPNGEFMLIR